MFNKTNKSGFTLVEVLIVIIIVGILIAALLPRLTGSQGRARDTARAGHLNQISQAVALFAADSSASVTGRVDATAAYTGFLSSIPVDPQGAGGSQSKGTLDTLCGAADPAGEYCVVDVASQGITVIGGLESDTAGNCGAEGVVGSGAGYSCIIVNL